MGSSLVILVILKWLLSQKECYLRQKCALLLNLNFIEEIVKLAMDRNFAEVHNQPLCIC